MNRFVGQSRPRAKSGGVKARRAKRVRAEQPSPVPDADRQDAEPAVAIDALPKATHQGLLCLEGVWLFCFVLEDERRLLPLGGAQEAIGMAASTGAGADAHGTRSLKPPDSPSLHAAGNDLSSTGPILFETLDGLMACGSDATLLSDLCLAIRYGRWDGTLGQDHARIVRRCRSLLSGFLRVGIIPRIDEATGYLEVRPPDSFAKIMQQDFLQAQGDPAGRLAGEFRAQLFRLGWPADPADSDGRLLDEARLLDDLVYGRLAPDALAELVPPRGGRGRSGPIHRRRLVEDLDHPKVQVHLKIVNVLMKLSDRWDDFAEMLDQLRPRWPEAKALGRHGDWAV